MTEGNYIFDDASDVPELQRLRMLEGVFDPETHRWVRSAGPLTAQRCLEVGAGAGSIAAWMASEVGPAGSVTAVDSNVRFLGWLPPHVEVIEGEMASVSVPEESFDLVHARYVLIHNVNARAVLQAMLRALKPGGVLVLEEPDFSAKAALTGPARLRRAFEHVKCAIEATFSSRGMDYAFGRLLPGLVQESAATLVAVEYDCAAQKGASALANMMRASTLTLQDKYIATGCAAADDIAGYAEFALAPECWGIYYATVRVLARKRAQTVQPGQTDA